MGVITLISRQPTSVIFLSREDIVSKVELPECLPRPLPVLTREKAAEYLTKLGYPTTRSSLARLAVSGGGPVYRKWGRNVLYRPDDLLTWIEERGGSFCASSAEHDAA